jgi:F-type H+-transporting ATPase subunit gamma
MVDASEIHSPLVQVREPKQILLIVVTSNRGLCGAFNSGLIKFADQFMADNYADEATSGRLQILPIGRKGFEYYQKRKFRILDDKNHDAFHNLSFETANVVADRVFEGFLKGEFDRVHLIYNEFKSIMSQTRRAELFLPSMVEQPKTVAGKAPAAARKRADYIFEPEKAQILTDLIPKALRTQLFRSLLESNAAEQGARMVAMDAATNNAQELIKDLRLQYNKARQAAITKEILEISAGADALSN